MRPDAPFVLYVVHALNPLRDTSFDDQRRFTDDLLAAIADRVATRRGGRRLQHERPGRELPAMDAALTDAMRAGEAGRTTYVGGWWTTLLLRIDHVFVDPSWCASGQAPSSPAGSDHRGVEVAVGPCP